VVTKATKRFEDSLDFADGYLLRMRVWEVPEPGPPSEHRFKYSADQRAWNRPAKDI